MGTKSFYGMGQGSFYGSGMYGSGQLPIGIIEKTIGPASIASFNDGLKNKPLKECVVNIEPVQTGSGDPSPENIRPITGWTGVVIRRTGKNLWGGDAILADVKADIPAAIVNDENRTVRYVSTTTDHGSFCGRNPIVHLKRGFQFEEGKQYTFVLTLSNSASKARSNLMVKYTDGTSVYIQDPVEANVKETIVYVSTAGKSVACLNKSRSDGSTTIYADESGIFEGVLTAEDFVPYEGSEVSVEFPEEAGAVYGGTLDLTAGILTVKSKKVQITTVTQSTNTSYAMTRIGDFGDIAAGEKMCNVLTVYGGSASSMAEGQCMVFNSSGYNRAQVIYWFPEMTGTTITARKASAQAILDELVQDGTPMEVVFPLSNPIVYQLTPQQITTLLGMNNIWADTGNITIKYLAKK